MSHHHAPGVSSRMVGTIARLTMAEGPELMLALVAERGLHLDLAELMDDARGDGFVAEPPSPDE